MEVLRLFRYWILRMVQWRTVTLQHALDVYNVMFDHMDGFTRAFTRRTTQGLEDLYFAMKFVHQELS